MVQATSLATNIIKNKMMSLKKTANQVLNFFQGENTSTQYTVLNHKTDLHFSKFNLVFKYDENNHNG